MAQNQGARDAHADLISVLYHLTHSEQRHSQYALDAKHAEDEELAQFLHEVREQQQRLAARAKQLLLERLSDAQREQREKEQHVSK